jgi:uncharacterized Zn-binding protein involved in type VI secretion
LSTQASGRHLLQGDPYTVFNEPATPTSVATGAPSVNINGVPAAGMSATSVPVMGSLAMPLPGANYAAGYAPAAVGGVQVRLGGRRLPRPGRGRPAARCGAARCFSACG